MTNKEKMLAGESYDPFDKELSSERARTRSILREFNASFGKETNNRNKLLGKLLGEKGFDTWVEPPFYCDYGSNIFLGESVYFNFDCTILDPARVVIGDQCLFGPKVQIYTATHPMDPEERAGGKEFAKEISIGNKVWIGGGVIILPGITIGSGSVIGAGSVVTKNIPENVLAVGNPCKIIKEL